MEREATNRASWSRDDTVSRISRTRAAANAFLQARLAQLGLGGLATSHGEILTALLARGEMQMGQLAGCIGRDPSTATALVKKLAALGYLQTRPAPHSRRAVLVSLTPRGGRWRGPFRPFHSSCRRATGRASTRGSWRSFAGSSPKSRRTCAGQ